MAFLTNRTMVFNAARRAPFRRTCRGGAVLCLCAFAIGLFPSATAGREEYTEYQVKAAFLYKFGDFVEWPAEAFADERAPLVIGILGVDPFGDLLDKTVKDKKVRNREIVIKRADSAAKLAGCHIVFVSSSEQDRLKEVLGAFAGQNVLTVGDCEKFTESGGVVEFVLAENKVGFEINAGAAKQAGLKISSQLLKLAKAVRDDGKNGT